MMAQAHECAWKKAVITDVKLGALARLAIKVSDLYGEFFSQSENSTYIPSSWKLYAKVKHKHFNAVAQSYKASESLLSGRYGEEITRLKLAQTYAMEACNFLNEDDATASVFDKLKSTVSAIQQTIQHDLVRAERDNSSKYKMPVLEIEQLSPILRSEMVKPVVPAFMHHSDYWLSLPDRPNDKLFIKRPLFNQFIPLAVHQAATEYKNEKTKLIEDIIKSKSRDFSENYQRLLEDLNLPYSVDIIDSVPYKLVQYAEEVQHEGGIQALFDMLQKVKSMSAKISKLLEKGFNALEMEIEENARLMKTWGKCK
ncbi:BRO1-like domain-containing protein [Mycotypha africana]|uniref:BRO1-like domain-containing protein n=1 Tax=Mycotypha africana TaxID=64632 RepID=UPI0023005293|nr:BRO1-like domain-containing protein [Mycotypha africana]KAI8966999.1 BRO1-like domain-containing protein [Mycotypha africana]